jgi:hypothetical protein
MKIHYNPKLKYHARELRNKGVLSIRDGLKRLNNPLTLQRYLLNSSQHVVYPTIKRIPYVVSAKLTIVVGLTPFIKGDLLT